jgi:hypothetical protein
MKPFKQQIQMLVVAFLFAVALPGYSQRGQPPNPPQTPGQDQPGGTPQQPKPPGAPQGPRPPRSPQAPGPARPPRADRPPRSPHVSAPIRPLWGPRLPYVLRTSRSSFLGGVSLHGGADHETIWLPQWTPAFRAVQLQANGGPIEIRHILVRYVDGSSDILPVRLLVGPNRPIRPIELPDPWRRVRSIELWFGDVYGPQPYVTAYGVS